MGAARAGGVCAATRGERFFPWAPHPAHTAADCFRRSACPADPRARRTARGIIMKPCASNVSMIPKRQKAFGTRCEPSCEIQPRSYMDNTGLQMADYAQPLAGHSTCACICRIATFYLFKPLAYLLHCSSPISDVFLTQSTQRLPSVCCASSPFLPAQPGECRNKRLRGRSDKQSQ